MKIHKSHNLIILFLLFSKIYSGPTFSRRTPIGIAESFLFLQIPPDTNTMEEVKKMHARKLVNKKYSPIDPQKISAALDCINFFLGAPQEHKLFLIEQEEEKEKEKDTDRRNRVILDLLELLRKKHSPKKVLKKTEMGLAESYMILGLNPDETDPEKIEQAYKDSQPKHPYKNEHLIQAHNTIMSFLMTPKNIREELERIARDNVFIEEHKDFFNVWEKDEMREILITLRTKRRRILQTRAKRCKTQAHTPKHSQERIGSTAE
jgi:hypothetical protein